MVGIRSIALALLTLALLPASAAATPTTQIIVKREPGVSGAERADIRADADVRLVDDLSLPRTEVVAAEPGDVGDAIRDLNADPDVVYAERDRAVTAFAAQLDQCGPYGAAPCLWGVARIFGGAPDAGWDLSTGAGRTVAVVDSGVDAAHPDLGGHVAAGYDWVEDDADPQDESGHGTHVAGTIAAVRDGNGVVGVAPDARVLPLRVLNGNGTGSTSDGIEAFNWAGGKGIRVVNASLGGLGFIRSEYDTFARHPDTLFVVAAGNAGQDNDNPSTAQYPCAYGIDHPSAPALDNILCVGASDGNEARADFSNYGATSVDLYAPGVDIASTMLGQYWRSAGTSMATPHVAATAALLAARNPTLTAIELKQTILVEAKPVAAGPRLDATAALGAVPADADGDLDLDAADNCPSVYNPGQENTDGDTTGDACEAGANAMDRDSDDVPDVADACPDEPWPGSDGCPLAAVTAPDTDHDGVSNTRDLCPNVTVSGGFGCRDDDDDRVPNDGRDNCPYVANTSQTDADADGAGDACDGTPRGLDTDGDGKPALDDACPSVHGTLANGCPPPKPSDRDGDGRPDVTDACPDEAAATPNGCPIAQIATVSPKVKKRTATVTVSTSRAATVKLLIQRKKGRGWVRVASKRLATVGNRATLTVKRLKPGVHRVKVSISSSGGAGAARTKSFRVR